MRQKEATGGAGDVVFLLRAIIDTACGDVYDKNIYNKSHIEVSDLGSHGLKGAAKKTQALMGATRLASGTENRERS